MDTIVRISTAEYALLKKKESLADDLTFQLHGSIKNLKEGKIKKVR